MAVTRVEIEFRRPRSYWQRCRGWYDPRQKRIVVYAHPLWEPLGIALTEIHELAHASGRPGCAGHRRGFRRLLLRLAAEQLGVDLGDPGEVARRYRSVGELERALWWGLVRVRVLGVFRSAWTLTRVAILSAGVTN